MNKQRFVLFLSIAWLAGLVVSLSSSARIPLHSGTGSSDAEKPIVQKLAGPQLFSRTSTDTPKTPPFEIDWGLYAKLNPKWHPLILTGKLPACFRPIPKGPVHYLT